MSRPIYLSIGPKVQYIGLLNGHVKLYLWIGRVKVDRTWERTAANSERAIAIVPRLSKDCSPVDLAVGQALFVMKAGAELAVTPNPRRSHWTRRTGGRGLA
jgi:hypothetical protein